MNRISDYIDKAYSNEKALSYFLTTTEVEEIKRILPKKLEYSFFGGYLGASRSRLIFNSNDFQISMLEAKFDPKFFKITHPDVLGTMMSCNLDRNRFGDILVFDNKIVVFVVAEIKRVVVEQVTEIKKCKIEFIEVDYEVKSQDNLIELSSSVSSLRLDAIVASIANTSREKAKDLIKMKSVSLNHQLIENHKKELKNGDIISIRRIGRFRFNKVVKESKKGRLIISYDQYA